MGAPIRKGEAGECRSLVSCQHMGIVDAISVLKIEIFLYYYYLLQVTDPHTDPPPSNPPHHRPPPALGLGWLTAVQGTWFSSLSSPLSCGPNSPIY